MNLQELKEKASQATPGEWKLDANFDPRDISLWADDTNGFLANLCEPDETGRYAPAYDIQRIADAHFISAANPTTVLELIAKIETQEKIIEEMKEAFINAVVVRCYHDDCHSAYNKFRECLDRVKEMEKK